MDHHSTNFMKLLTQSLQGLCSKHLSFMNDVAVSGHLNFWTDSTKSMEFVVNEKVLKKNGLDNFLSCTFSIPLSEILSVNDPLADGVDSDYNPQMPCERGYNKNSDASLESKINIRNEIAEFQSRNEHLNNLEDKSQIKEEVLLLPFSSPNLMRSLPDESEIDSSNFVGELGLEDESAGVQNVGRAQAETLNSLTDIQHEENDSEDNRKMRRKRKAHSLQKKAEILREVEAHFLSRPKICKKYGIPSTTLSTWIKEKDKILSMEGNLTKKRMRKPQLAVSR